MDRRPGIFVCGAQHSFHHQQGLRQLRLPLTPYTVRHRTASYNHSRADAEGTPTVGGGDGQARDRDERLSLPAVVLVSET